MHGFNHDADEPHILPDIGAKDGLCGDRWAIHAGQWANAHGHKPYADQLPERRTVSGVGSGSQHADERVHIPIGLEDTKGRKFLSKYRAAMVRNSNLPALLGIDSLERLNAVISCKTGEMWFMDDEGCDIKPKGDFVHLQMKKAKTGHWYLPAGRFGDAMTKLGAGHMAATSSTPPSPSQPSPSSE